MANKFFIGRCELDLYVENSHSLKEKRRVIKSIKEKLRKQFNVSICEYGDLSLWQRCQLGLIACSNERFQVDSLLRKAIQSIDNMRLVTLLDFKICVIE